MFEANKFGQYYELVLANKPYMVFESIAAILGLTNRQLRDILVNDFNGHKGIFGKDVHFDRVEDAEDAADWANGILLAKIIKSRKIA